MALTFSPTIIFVIISGIIILLIAILATIDYQLRKGKALQKQSLEYRYTLRFKELKRLRLEPRALIDGVDRLARDFMQEQFGVDGKMDYSQLIETFKNRGKPYAISFCEKMLEILYSGESASSNDARTVLNGLELMLRQEGALTIVVEEPEEKTQAAVEGENFLTSFVRKMSARIELWRAARKDINTTIKSGPVDKTGVTVINTGMAQETVSTPVEEKEKKPQPVFEPVRKREYIIPKDKRRTEKEGKKENRYYKNIASVDALDRIESRIKSKRENKIAETKK